MPTFYVIFIDEMLHEYDIVEKCLEWSADLYITLFSEGDTALISTRSMYMQGTRLGSSQIIAQDFATKFLGNETM